MKIKISKRFVKDTQNITDKRILSKIRDILVKSETITNINELENLIQLSGFSGYYRIKFDHHYRIGLFFDGDTIAFLRVGKREDFYKKFP
jgi:mRNA-degrading endonuclease RelE of RelBE toxin-antitoxin system